MAGDSNGNGGRTVTLGTTIQISAIAVLLGGVGAVYQILHSENVASELRMKERIERVQQETDRHGALEGHPGVLAQLSGLRASIDTERAERKGAYDQNRGRIEAQEHLTEAMAKEIMVLVEETSTLRGCLPQRK